MNPVSDTSSTSPAIDSCWRRIGVWGDKSCPELAEHVHCGNCPVFSAAGRSLLERAAPENYLSEWAEVLGAGGEQREVTVSVLLFRLGPSWLALPAAVIASITEMRSPHRVPHRTSNIFTGLVNIAGELQLAFDLRALFELSSDSPLHLSLSCQVYPRMILCRRPGQSFAFAADEVYGAVTLTTSKMQPTPATTPAALSVYIRGQFSYRKRPLLLLDDELLATALDRLHLS